MTGENPRNESEWRAVPASIFEVPENTNPVSLC